MSTIAVYSTHPDTQAQACALAASLQLPLVSNEDSAVDYLLLVTPEYIGLKKMRARANPLIVDFLSAQIQYRVKQATLKNETLARAIGREHRHCATILDGTGGLGLDSFMLATLGFSVTLLERSPIVAILLKDGLERAQLTDKIQLIVMDTVVWLKNNAAPEVIYLDPMFPVKNKSAAVKQSMQIFHDIVGADADAATLLETALACAAKRVVVKRPRAAAPIAAKVQPSFNMTGRSCRFDIYLRRG